MIRVGITGGIGSGKSVVSKLFSVMGIPVYNCDAASKELTVKDDGIREKLIELVGPEVYVSDGSLNKALLASWLFKSDAHVQKVNAIIHPAVKRDFLQWVDRQQIEGYTVCAMESAILFEARFEDVVDKIVVVSASMETRIQRTMQRDHLEREAVLERISRQLDDAVKVGRADFVVHNEGEQLLIPQLSGFIASLFQK